MTSLEYAFADPDLVAAPPVLVDVGAAGDLHPIWRKIARFSIGVGFEPDAREAPSLSTAQRQFKRWVFCPCLATAENPAGGHHPLHLARAPQCSSSLKPRQDRLKEWVFADQFEVVRTENLPAKKLSDALHEEGIDTIDWLKCDTQGTDLRLFLSLPKSIHASISAVELEPGIMEAYAGEDHSVDVMAAMRGRSYWLADFRLGKTPRGRAADLANLGSIWSRNWIRRLAPTAPGWAGLTYLRDVSLPSPPPNRRDWLLVWVFATLLGQHGYAVSVATQGRVKFPGERFDRLHAESLRSLKWAMVQRFPRWAWDRLTR